MSTLNALEIIMSNEELSREWQRLQTVFLEENSSNADPSTTAALNAARLLYMKRRFVFEMLLNLLLTKPADSQQAEQFLKLVYGFSTEFNLNEDLFQVLQSELHSRIKRIQAALGTADTAFSNVVLVKKREIASRISKIYIEFFIFCCTKLTEAVCRLKKILKNVQETFCSEQLITSYKGNISERLNYYMKMTEMLQLKGNVALSKILQSLYTPENIPVLSELSRELTCTIEKSKVELEINQDALKKFTLIGSHYEEVCTEIRQKRVQIQRLRNDIEKLFQQQQQHSK